MEPWIPHWPSQPRGKAMAPSKEPDRGLRSGHHQPVPHSHHNGERFYPWQDVHGSPKPQQDPRADHQQPRYASRPGEWPQPGSGVDYYEGAYPAYLYSRAAYEDPYQRHLLREEYAYAGYYYGGRLQRRLEERVPRQGSPYVRHDDYEDQNYLNEPHRENRNSPFGTNNETQFHSTSRNAYKDSPASSSGHKQTGELLPESLLTGGPKNKQTSKSNLLQQQESGLSSSSYELSQYMTDTAELYDPVASTAWSPIQTGPVSAVGPKTPTKFYIPHVSVSFGPGGQLVCVCPSSPMDGQAPLIELHSMEVILNDSEAQEEMRNFSGPLTRQDVHKVDIMTFCQQKAAQSLKSGTSGSRDSSLLWQLLVLLCRQNGSMVGSDIAELLMQDCRRLEKYTRQPPVANLISLTDEDWPVMNTGTRNLLTGEVPPTMETPEQVMEKFTKLLYYGRKKEALEWAMKNHLWGHALFLSSKMDPRTYNWVMSGFTSTLALNDPLQTLFQLMSGRIPQAATCCGDKQWGDWRPHLAVILSNQSGDPELHRRAVVTMGDTLAGKGCVEAAHFCYLMAHVPFGHFTVKTDLLALLGSSHSQEFLKFATTEAIQRTEVFEYCRMLGRPGSFIPSFQVYKLLYAARLADHGLASQALHYCEAIGEAVLSQGESSHPVLVVELIKLAEKLKLSDPLVLERHHGDREREPDWLVQLRGLQRELERKGTGDIRHPQSARSDILGAKQTTDTSYQDLSGHRPTGSHSPPRPTLEQIGPVQPGPLPQQLGPLLAHGVTGHPAAPVPLSSVPEMLPSGTGDVDGGVAAMDTPRGRAWEETRERRPSPGVNTVSQETSQPYDSQNVIPKPQVPPAPRARSFSENPGVSFSEDAVVSSEEADKKPPANASQREKSGDLKDNAKSSGFGWFSWFRSKASDSPSEEDSSSSSSSSDCTDSEASPTVSSPCQTSPGPSPALPLESPSQPDTSSFSRGTGGDELPESLSSGNTAGSTAIGGFSGLEGVSSELCSAPGVLPPPPSLQGAVPLYNPSQVPQLSKTTSLNRTHRLAQRRYPTQPC